MFQPRPRTVDRNSSTNSTNGSARMVENETLQDAKGNTGVYNGPVLVPDQQSSPRQQIVHPSDDPDAPPPPLTDISLDDEDEIKPLPHGKYGQMVYMNHDEYLKYTGDWDHGLWTKGTCLYTNGNVYSGPWNPEGQPHGPNGKLEWVFGSAQPGVGDDTRTYQGDWSNGMRHGQGTYAWSRTGAVYQGAFESNQRQGHGSYRDPSAQIEYVGEWKQGVYHGYGQYTWIDPKLHEKCVYRGAFQDGKPHGEGIQVNSKGEVMHEGKWEHGKPVKKQQVQPETPQPARTPQPQPPPVRSTPKQTRAPPVVMPTPRAPPDNTPAPTSSRRPPNPAAASVAAPGMTPTRPSSQDTTPKRVPAVARTPAPSSAPPPGGGSVTVVHDREWMDTVNQPQPTLGIYRGLWLHQNPYQNGVVHYQTGEVLSYEGWFNPQGYYHGQGCRLLFRNGDSYDGDFQYGQRHGKGVYTWSDGRQYKGVFSKNARHGTGTLIYPNSDFYEGGFSQGKRQGHGRFIFATGSMYEGTWRAGYYHGQGTLVQADGSTYVGEFYMGAKHGKGKDLNSMGTLVYEGFYFKGKPKIEGQNENHEEDQETSVLPEQQGKMTYQTPQKTSNAPQPVPSVAEVESYWVGDDDDDPEPLSPPVAVEEEPPCEAVVDQEITDCQGNVGRFTGIVLSSTKRPHGVGRLVYADGKRIHEGFWKNGSKEGHGRCLFFPQGDFHEGEYQNNLRNGPGRYQWKDGRLFMGQYKDDMRHGKGTFSYPSGDKYEGMFAKGQRNGYGRFVFSGGNYEGEWSGGKYHGHGRLVWGRGTEYEGEFSQGTFHGMGVLRDFAGNVLEEGRWYQGKRVATLAPRAPPPAASPPPPPQPAVPETPAPKQQLKPAHHHHQQQQQMESQLKNEQEETDPASPLSPPEHDDNDNDNPVATATTITRQIGGENTVEQGNSSHNNDEDAAPKPVESYVVDEDNNDSMPVTAVEL